MTPTEPAPPAPDAAVPGPDPGPVLDAPVRPGRAWAFALVAATLAGVGAFLAGEPTRKHFLPPVRMVRAMGATMNVPDFHEQCAADRKNASLATGILGGLLGLALGAAGGLARGSARSAALAGVVGLVAGSAAGIAASEAILRVYYRQLDTAAEALADDMIIPLLVHAVSWAAVGAATGAAFGLGIGGPRKVTPALVGGLIGGALGAAGYEVIGALAFPDGKTTDPIAASQAARLIARLAASLGATALAAFAVLAPPRARKAAG